MNVQMAIRRVAGSFVLVSLGLGWWVHPAWFLMTTFVGLNLFQSSFTGFCPLETLLVRYGRGKGRAAEGNSSGT